MEEIYHAALPLRGPERLEFVAQRCADDAALREEVMSLLVSDEAVADFLQEPVAELVVAVLADETLRDTEIMSQPIKIASVDLVGERVAGRYEVTKRLGGGGFGDVYKATDAKVMSRPVVIKVLKDEVSMRQGAIRDWVVTKFKQEIEALAKINDSGVIRIFDADTLPDGRPYIVMEFVEGSDLRQFIKVARQAHLTEQGLQFHDIAEIVRQVGRTLTAAHEAEVFHRDLKPENIMLRRNPSGDLQVKVIDFGIAKVRNSLVAPSTATGLFVAGTWQYMAPEQLLGKKVNAACDVYALGVIAYELVTGRYPFPAGDPAQLKEMQEAGVKVKPSDLNPALPAAAQEAMLKALAYYPAERPKRARDFGDELAHALTTAEELARPAPPANVIPEGETLEEVDESGQSEGEKAVIAHPRSFSVPISWLAQHKHLVYATSTMLLAGLIVIAVWLAVRPSVRETPTTPQPSPVMTNAGPERSLTFWLRVKMPIGDGTFEEFDSTGEEAFKAGSKVYFRVQPLQEGFLYIINEGMGDSGAKKWTALFPNPKDNNGSAQLAAGRQQEITGMTLDDNPGDEIIRFVWATDPVRDLEPLFQFEFKDGDRGVFADPAQQTALRDFFQRHRETPEDKIFDNGAQPRVTMKGRDGLLVNSLTIKHRKYGTK